MALLPLIALTLLAVCHGAYYEESAARLHPQIRAKTSKWQPGYNKYFEGMSKQNMVRLLGTLRDDPEEHPKKWILTKVAVPDTFDSRQQWPVCAKQIGFIRDQGDCGSCWAVSSAEVMTDRTCIKFNGTQAPYLSDEDILICCITCGFGCGGGYPSQAFKFWNMIGVVTGGPYGSNQGCRPYSTPPKGVQDPDRVTDPTCIKQCESSYKIPYPQDEHKGTKYYSVQGGANAMQQEMLANGPISASFDVYEDFFQYTSGVYHHVSGDLVGGHAVKVIGWGTDNGTPYWLVANSWNASWGLQGYFKIQRGNNECGFEADIMAGIA